MLGIACGVEYFHEDFSLLFSRAHTVIITLAIKSIHLL
jgi:hypothetical protein